MSLQGAGVLLAPPPPPYDGGAALGGCAPPRPGGAEWRSPARGHPRREKAPGRHHPVDNLPRMMGGVSIAGAGPPPPPPPPPSSRRSRSAPPPQRRAEPPVWLRGGGHAGPPFPLGPLRFGGGGLAGGNEGRSTAARRWVTHRPRHLDSSLEADRGVVVGGNPAPRRSRGGAQAGVAAASQTFSLAAMRHAPDVRPAAQRSLSCCSASEFGSPRRDGRRPARRLFRGTASGMGGNETRLALQGDAVRASAGAGTPASFTARRRVATAAPGPTTVSPVPYPEDPRPTGLRRVPPNWRVTAEDGRTLSLSPQRKGRGLQALNHHMRPTRLW